jgi:hypothetical protein
MLHKYLFFTFFVLPPHYRNKMILICQQKGDPILLIYIICQQKNGNPLEKCSFL